MTPSMKTIQRIVAGALVVLFAFGLTMCGQQEQPAPEPTPAAPAVAETPPPAPEPAPDEPLTAEEEAALKEEFAVESEEQIGEENLEDVLANLEKEVEADQE